MDAEKFAQELERLESEIQIDHIMSLDINPAMKLLDLIMDDEVRRVEQEIYDPRLPTEYRLDCIGCVRGLKKYREKIETIRNRTTQLFEEKEQERQREAERNRNPLTDALQERGSGESPTQRAARQEPGHARLEEDDEHAVQCNEQAVLCLAKTLVY